MTELVNCLAKLSPIAQYKSAKMTVESNVPAFLVVADGDRHFPADRTYPNRAVQFYQLKRNLARASKPARAAAYLSCRTELA